ncbi:sensor histidine kinase [Rhizobium rhizosphaerae]|uniref:Sensor histidine kinase n=1 Tax=Xaviernesmea rhizosphaerae TaxID=1672749 RepID=A0ABX3PAA3_9HYPH|nr:TspO/MBR family protein [Xaviernesmea rhizosphaerae]OQP85359.1 sensor histidine kinase [Xaviernesmea rhizosphaerae]
MNRLLVTLLFIAVVLGIGLLIGISNPPGEWYQSLVKPAFNPPNWIFAPVWSALYMMIGFVGARLFLDHPRSSAMRLWLAQLLLNFAWSPMFFGFHQVELALVVILALGVCILLFIAMAMKRDRLSAMLFIPYGVWVAFATLLNGAIMILN